MSTSAEEAGEGGTLQQPMETLPATGSLVAFMLTSILKVLVVSRTRFSRCPPPPFHIGHTCRNTASPRNNAFFAYAALPPSTATRIAPRHFLLSSRAKTTQSHTAQCFRQKKKLHNTDGQNRGNKSKSNAQHEKTKTETERDPRNQKT